MSSTVVEASELPKVEVALSRVEVFAGEDPGLALTVIAPATEAVSVVKAELAHLGFLRADLIGPNGRRVPGGGPHALRLDEPDDFARLEAGKTITLRQSVGSQPPAAGEYRVDVAFRPTADRDHVVQKQLKLTSRLLTPQDIVSQMAVALPAGADVKEGGPTMDLLVVKTGGGHTLFYRRSGPEGQVRLQRLWTVAESVKPVTEVVGYDRGRVAGTIRVTYDQGGKPVVAEVDYWTGGVVTAPPQAVGGKPDEKSKPDK